MSVSMKLFVLAIVLAVTWAADESESDRNKKEVYGATGVDNAYYNPYYNRGYNADARYPYDSRYSGYAGYTDPRYYNNADPRYYNNNADPRYYNNAAYYDPRYSGVAGSVAGYPGYYNNRYTAGRYTADKYYDPAAQGYYGGYRAPYTGYPGYYGAAAAAPYRKI